MKKLVKQNGQWITIDVPDKAPALPYSEITAGSYFTNDNDIARVRVSKSSGRPYAELLRVDSHKFEYVQGLVYRLARRMTLAEAKEYGALHGVCCVCAATLTDPKSIDAGIGPICAKRV